MNNRTWVIFSIRGLTWYVLYALLLFDGDVLEVVFIRREWEGHVDFYEPWTPSLSPTPTCTTFIWFDISDHLSSRSLRSYRRGSCYPGLTALVISPTTGTRYSHAPVCFGHRRYRYVEQTYDVLAEKQRGHEERRGQRWDIMLLVPILRYMLYICLVYSIYLRWNEKEREKSTTQYKYTHKKMMEYLVSSVWVWVDFRKSSLFFCLVFIMLRSYWDWSAQRPTNPDSCGRGGR